MECKFCNQYSCNCHHFILRTSSDNGRLCNQLIRNIVTSFIAEKIDLYVEYSSHDRIKRLGIPLYVGKKIYSDTIALNEENYMEIFKNTPYVNINPNKRFFQDKQFSKMIYNYLRGESIKSEIISKNPYNIRYNNNNDCFIHVRLGDIADHNMNFKLSYYLNALKEITNFDRLYVASDSPDHEIVQGILDVYYGKSQRLLLDEIETIQFGSTCRNIILSYGTYSAVIGWLSFYSDVYYPEFIEGKMWCGDVYSVDDKWHKLKIV